MRLRRYLFSSALALLPFLPAAQAQTISPELSRNAAAPAPPAALLPNSSLPALSYWLVDALPARERTIAFHIKRHRFWERRLEKLYRPRFDRRIDQRILYMTTTYGPGGMERALLHNELTERAVEKLAGRVGSELIGEYGGPVEHWLAGVEEAIDAWLKRRKLVFDSEDHPSMLHNGDSLHVKLSLNFSINNPIGIEGEYRSRFGKFDFSCFPDQAALNYRLWKIDGGELYAGLYQSFERKDRGIVAFVRLPIASLLGREHP